MVATCCSGPGYQTPLVMIASLSKHELSKLYLMHGVRTYEKEQVLVEHVSQITQMRKDFGHSTGHAAPIYKALIDYEINEPCKVTHNTFIALKRLLVFESINDVGSH